MSKKNRCYLCGGKLSRGYCTDCGLDNTKLERVHYHLNESNAARRLEMEKSGAEREKPKREKKGTARIKPVALAGTGRDNPKKRNSSSAASGASGTGGYSAAGTAGTGRYSAFGTIENANKKQKTSGFGKQKRSSSSGGKIKLVIGCIGIVIALTGFLIDFIKDHQYDTWSSHSESSAEYNPYEYLDRELAETGDSFEIELTEGAYLVGVHLPEGTYKAELVEGSGGIDVEDNANGIYLWENFGTDPDYDEVTEMDDLRLFQGARVEINRGVTLKLTTENGQTDKMEAIPNPLTEEYTLEVGRERTAGEDFPAGVYDVQVKSDWALFDYNVPTEKDYVENGMYERSLWLEADENNGVYRNLVLTEGTVICSEDEEIVLIPSEIIGTMDYSDYYEY